LGSTLIVAAFATEFTIVVALGLFGFIEAGFHVQENAKGI
jgi:hypothetical protein